MGKKVFWWAPFFDASWINLNFIFSFLIRFGGKIPPYNFLAYQRMWLFFSFLYIFVLYLMGLYREEETRTHSLIWRNSIKANSISTLLFISITYVGREIALAFPTSVFLISFILSTLSVAGWRSVVRWWERKNWEKGLGLKNVLILGVGKKAGEIGRKLKESPFLGYRLVGYLRGERERKNPSIEEDEILGGKDSLAQILKEKNVQEVIIALPNLTPSTALELILGCQREEVKFHFIPSIYELFLGELKPGEIGNLVTLELSADPISGWKKDFKRGMDVVLSLLALALLSPLIGLLALLIKLDSPGPVFFKQERMGKNGRIFQICKFRSMKPEAEKETGPTLAKEEDKRITPIGRWMRRHALDEIPQLLNVLKGEMSLVGPRPERPYFMEEFKKFAPAFWERLRVKPGITGLAQVKAPYDTEVQTKLKYDMLYLHQWSPFLDLWLIFKTLGIILKGWGRR